MHPTSSSPISSGRSRSIRGVCLCGTLAGLVAGLMAAHSAYGQSINIPNYSFENPSTGFVSTIINNWTKTSQPSYFDPSTYGFTWDQTSGVFVNTTTPANEITNLDGNQAAFILNFPGAGFSQDLSTTYTVGQQYVMSFGAISETNAGSTLMLVAYYRDGGGNIVPVSTDTVTSQGSGVPNITQLQYSTLTIPIVNATDPWAGQPIGIEVVVGNSTGGQDWDVDNIVAAPEPASGGLLAFGALSILSRRRRRNG